MKLEDRESLIIHIEGLQATLAKRNARIAELEKIISNPMLIPEKVQKEIDKAYKKGWKDCSQELMEITKTAAISLGKIRKDAYSQYLKGEKDE